MSEVQHIAESVRHDPICEAWQKHVGRPCTCGAQRADCDAARRRLVKASDAWVEHEEALLPIKEEYYAAFAALEAAERHIDG